MAIRQSRTDYFRKALFGCVGAALAGLASSPAAATDGYFSHGYGTQAAGLGGAAIAYPKDSLAIATNPASLFALGDRIDLGVEWFKPDRGASINGNLAGPDQSFDGSGLENFFIPEFGYATQIDRDWAAGFAVYGNGGMNTHYRTNPFARFGSTGVAGVNLEQLFVSAGARLSVGTGATNRSGPQHRLSALQGAGHRRLRRLLIGSERGSPIATTITPSAPVCASATKAN